MEILPFASLPNVFQILAPSTELNTYLSLCLLGADSDSELN